MKHTALILAVLIFAFSLVSCSDLNYYKGTGWDCSQEEFYANHYDTTKAKLKELATENGIDIVLESADLSDDHFMIVVYDDKFTCYFNFNCEELWGTVSADLYFYGSDESELNDYAAQKKYVDYLNAVLCNFAYDMNTETNVFESSYNYCTAEVRSYEKVLVRDAMTGGVAYGVKLDTERNVINHTLRGDKGFAYKCNLYHYKGLLDGSFDNVHAEQ